MSKSKRDPWDIHLDVSARGRGGLWPEGFMVTWGWGTAQEEGYSPDEVLSLVWGGAPVAALAWRWAWRVLPGDIEDNALWTLRDICAVLSMKERGYLMESAALDGAEVPE